jgi:hypothetical protein
MPFVARDSFYKGEYYSARGESEEHFELIENFNKIEEDWTEPEDEEWPLLLYVSGTQRPVLLEEAIKKAVGSKVTLLSREEYENT